MRTIIELPEEQVGALREICEREGISRAEAIRRAVRAYTRKRAGNVADAFGLWKDREVDGLTYEDRVRREWAEARDR